MNGDAKTEKNSQNGSYGAVNRNDVTMDNGDIKLFVDDDEGVEGETKDVEEEEPLHENPPDAHIAIEADPAAVQPTSKFA